MADKTAYPKQIQSFAEQIRILKQRGLIITDEQQAEKLLRRVSYYRLSGYWYPFLADREQHIFKPGSKLEQAVLLYHFDSELRRLFLSALERIEIAVRTQIAYVMSMEKGGYWFEDETLFAKVGLYHNTIGRIADEFRRSDEQFVKAFKQKYTNPLPPSWMTLEITSFGTMSILYANLKPGQAKRNVAVAFGLADKVFASWLHTLVYIRNLCAHHSRLWNRTLGVRALMPKRIGGCFIQEPADGTQRTYFVASIITYLLNIIDPQNTFVADFKALLRKYPTVDPRAMGCPTGWEQEPLWRQEVTTSEHSHWLCRLFKFLGGEVTKKQA